MKNSNEVIFNRHDTIVKLLEEHDTLSVSVLSEKLMVSELTIRRDLNTLEKMNKIERFRGGAKAINVGTEENLSAIEKIKEVLSKQASTWIKNDQTLFMNTSSTALAVLKYIGDKQVTVITNNVRAYTVDNLTRATIILSGGEIRFPKKALVGDIAIDSFSKMSSDITIIGCSGLSVDGGLTTSNLHESKINSVIIERTKGLKIVVADYRKIGFDSNFNIAKLSDIDILITDTFSKQSIIHDIEDLGILVVQVEV